MVSVDKQVNEKSKHFKFFYHPNLGSGSFLAHSIKNIEADNNDKTATNSMCVR